MSATAGSVAVLRIVCHRPHSAVRPTDSRRHADHAGAAPIRQGLFSAGAGSLNRNPPQVGRSMQVALGQARQAAAEGFLVLATRLEVGSARRVQVAAQPAQQVPNLAPR